ncbi:hypothetical protein Q7C18_02600 [Nesterenkonia sp. CL21]|uniref:hypothetical protein n=1 Tax=Nesterenkonia sp. CL21 TaxID=3064894 RepID=UPI00287A3653|nr:hypothetical protein [Nesterenkonia sp. CL21]MDS2171578.1 hypothetical protein [Nesterenkonia sp. CL21]
MSRLKVPIHLERAATWLSGASVVPLLYLPFAGDHKMWFTLAWLAPLATAVVLFARATWLREEMEPLLREMHEAQAEIYEEEARLGRSHD